MQVSIGHIIQLVTKHFESTKPRVFWRHHSNFLGHPHSTNEQHNLGNYYHKVSHVKLELEYNKKLKKKKAQDIEKQLKLCTPKDKVCPPSSVLVMVAVDTCLWKSLILSSPSMSAALRASASCPCSRWNLGESKLVSIK